MLAKLRQMLFVMSMIAQNNKMAVQEEIIQDWKLNKFVNNKSINKQCIVFTAKIRGWSEMNEIAYAKSKYRQKDDNAHHNYTALD